MAMFPKRAGRFMKALFLALNATTFTSIPTIADPLVSGEETANVDRTVKILSDMEYVEVQTDANGVKSLRLTPSGVAHSNAFFVEVK